MAKTGSIASGSRARRKSERCREQYKPLRDHLSETTAIIEANSKFGFWRRERRESKARVYAMA